MSGANKLVSLEDFLAMPEAVRGERSDYIGGQIVQKALPGGRHGRAEGAVVSLISSIFRRKGTSDGRGGWWIMPETSVLYPKVREIHTHDIVGWRRDHVPTEPLDYPVRERPDWVCEVSVSTLRKDTRDLKRSLEIEGIPHYWVVDTANEQLLVFEHNGTSLAHTRSLFREDGLQRIPPFDSLEIAVGLLLGDDPED